MLPIYAEMQVPLISGCHEALLAELIDCAAAVAVAFVDWLHDEGGRQEPPDASSVEVEEPDPTGPLALAQQEAGDQEAADDEEDVDADVAADQAEQVGMEEQDDEDRDSPQPFDVGPEAVAR